MGGIRRDGLVGRWDFVLKMKNWRTSLGRHNGDQEFHPDLLKFKMPGRVACSLIRLKMYMAYDAVIPLLGMNPRETRVFPQRETHLRTFTAAKYTALSSEQLKCPFLCSEC